MATLPALDRAGADGALAGARRPAADVRRRAVRGRGLSSSSSRATTAASRPGIWLLLAAWRGWRPAGEALRALGALALGVALIIGAAALHGALTGFHDWWFAVADYRLSVESVATGSVSERFSLFTRLAAHRRARSWARSSLLALPGVWLALRRRETVLLAIWFVLSLTGLRARRALPRPLLRGAADAALRARGADARRVPAARSASRSGCAVLILPAYKAWPSYTADGTRERSLASSSDSRIVTDGAVGRYLHAHTRPGRPHLRALRRRRPVSRRRPPLALSVPLVPRHRAHPRRAAAPARHARRPGRAALHRRLPAAARRSTSSGEHRPHARAPLPARRDDRGRADLAPARLGRA